MNASLNTRQLQLVGVLVLVVVAAAGYLVVSKHKTNTPTTASSTPAVTTPAHTTPAPSKAPATHAVTPVKVDTHGLPVPVVLALRKHSVVVVSLVTPRGGDDQIAVGEAAAAAAETKAGFVAINVFNQRFGTAILHKLGVVQTPTTLVVKRPGLIYSQFPGFADRDVVAQAVADAR